MHIVYTTTVHEVIDADTQQCKYNSRVRLKTFDLDNNKKDKTLLSGADDVCSYEYDFLQTPPSVRL